MTELEPNKLSEIRRRLNQPLAPKTRTLLLKLMRRIRKREFNTPTRSSHVLGPELALLCQALRVKPVDKRMQDIITHPNSHLTFAPAFFRFSDKPAILERKARDIVATAMVTTEAGSEGEKDDVS